MKLYAFQPQGHGQTSFFVMARDENEARGFINARVAELTATEAKLRREANPGMGDERRGWLPYEVQGWPENYVLTAYDHGEIAENAND
jgi:hypothetical protein